MLGARAVVGVATLSPKQRAKAIALLRERHEQDRVIWEKRQAAYILLDELDTLEAKRLDYKDIAEQCGISATSLHWLAHPNKRG